MAWAFLLLNICVVTAAACLRFWRRGLEFAFPWPWPLGFWTATIVVLVVAATALVVRDRKQLSVTSQVRALCELLVFPAFFAYEWAVLPPLMSAPGHETGVLSPLVWRPVDWAALGALGLLVSIFFFLDRRNWRAWGVSGRNFAAASKLLAIPTLLLVAAPVAAGLLVGRDLDPDFRVNCAVLLASVLTYPLYALAQLMIFQVFLVQRLKIITRSRLSVVLVSACTFALLHWPNPPVMAACGVAAAVWTWVYLARPNVYALAISMGLAASAFSHFVPRSITHNLRTGPIYVERCLEDQRDSGPAGPVQ